jgi:hypothetical protein
MSEISPMGYFDPKNAKQIVEESQEDLLNYLQEIVGFSELKSYLYTLTGMSKFRELRESYGLKGGGVSVPDVYVLIGSGDKKEASRHLSKHYKKMKMIKSSGIYRANLNDYIYAYVSNARDALDKLFDKAKSATLVIAGFEELVKNPRPPISDWHDWDDVLCNFVSELILKNASETCTMLSITQKTYDHLLKCYPKLRKLNRKTILCPRYSADEMAKKLEQKIKEDGYDIEEDTLHELSLIFQQVANHAVRVKDSNAISSLFNKILDRQKQRLSKVPLKHLSGYHLKSIKSVDIPSLSIPVDRDNVIYL